jgi:monovalent cation:H+ antiporter-2, CPA2 family
MVEALIVDLGTVFVAAGILLVVAHRFNLPSVPFYLLAGLGVGLVIDQADLLVLAQWGIAFLVFVFGIRLNLGDLEKVLRDGETAAMSQLLVVAPIAFLIGYFLSITFGFPDPLRNAIYFSAAAILSSTIVGAGLLDTEIRESLIHGRLASSIHFFDDLVAIALILILSAETMAPDIVAANIGYGVFIILAGIIVYRHAFPLMVRACDGSDELVLMGCVSILVVFLAAAELVGISIVVGAFAAGIAIRNDDTQSLEVQNGIDSIRDFFVTIFFVTVGALVSVPTLEMIAIASVLIVLVIFINPIVLLWSFIYEGYDSRTAFLSVSGLNQVSEFSIIIAIQAFLMGTIAESMFNAIILAAAITMILTAFIRQYEEQLYSAIIPQFFGQQQTQKVDDDSRIDTGLEDHVIIVGYGRQGRRIVQTLEEIDQPYVVMENDPSVYERLENECKHYVFGDAMAEYPWEKAGAETASLIISTVDHPPVSETVLEIAPTTDADIVLRSDDSETAQSYLEKGATYVIVSDILTGEQLIEVVKSLLNEEISRANLKSEHIAKVDELERYGFVRPDERF